MEPNGKNSSGEYASREYLNWDNRIRGTRIRVAIAWIIDFLMLACTIFAAITVIFLATGTSTDELIRFMIAVTCLSLVISAVITTIVVNRSFEISLTAFGRDVRKQNHGIVFDIVEEMSVASGNQIMPEVYIAISKIPNACAISNGERSAVIVTSELLKTLNRDETQAVIAHEIGHLISGDSPAMTKLVSLVSITGIISGMTSRMIWVNDSDNKNPLAILLIIICFIFLLLAPVLSLLVSSKSSRDRERRADAYSAKLTRNPTALATALLKLDSDDPDVDEKEQSAYDKIGAIAFRIPSKKDIAGAFDSHPTTHERVQSMIDMGADTYKIQYRSNRNELTVWDKINQ